MNSVKELGFIGFGNMGSSIYSAAVRSGFLKPSQVSAYDVDPSRILPEVEKSSSVKELCEKSKRILIAVKPVSLGEVLEDLKKSCPSLTKKLLITIVAGVPMEYYFSVLGEEISIARVMPNTPLLVGEGFSAIAFSKDYPEEEEQFVVDLFKSSGEVEVVEERLMDAITGFTGSGPGFVFMLINAFAEGGTFVGIPKAKAIKMAARVFMGSAKMILETGMHPEQLKDMVASPGGTTVEGLKALEEGAVRNHLVEAVRRATLKSRSISTEFFEARAHAKNENN